MSKIVSYRAFENGVRLRTIKESGSQSQVWTRLIEVHIVGKVGKKGSELRKQQIETLRGEGFQVKRHVDIPDEVVDAGLKVVDNAAPKPAGLFARLAAKLLGHK